VDRTVVGTRSEVEKRKGGVEVVRRKKEVIKDSSKEVNK
jgi:hypothetical protein